MTTITKERLLTIKQWRETYGPGSNVVLPAEEAEELARIALASLEAEPLVPVMYKGMKLLTKEGLELIRDGIAEATGLEAMCMADALLSGAPAPVVPDDWQLVPKKITLEMECALSKADSYEIGWLWALAAAPKYEVQNAKRVQNALNACRAAMLQSQGEGNPHVTPARLPDGFTIEDAKALHEDLVRSHISQALSGEKMKKKDRDADLRWIHGVIVQAACFVKASLEAEPMAWRYRYVKKGIADSQGEPWFGDWKYVPTKEDCNDRPNYEIQALFTAPPVLLTPEGLIKAVRFYEQVKRENPPVETGAWKDAVDWVLKEACQAVNIGIKGE